MKERETTSNDAAEVLTEAIDILLDAQTPQQVYNSKWVILKLLQRAIDLHTVNPRPYHSPSRPPIHTA